MLVGDRQNMNNKYWDIEKNGIYLIYCSTQLLIDVSNKLVLEFYTRGKNGAASWPKRSKQNTDL